MTGNGSNVEEPTGKTMIGEYTEEYLLERAREVVKERTQDWEIANVKAEQRIPKFYRDGECKCK